MNEPIPPCRVIEVRFRPAPQGSKRCFCRGGKATMLEETSKHLKPFRKAVTAEARALYPTVAVPPLDGPLVVTLTFALERPAKTKFGDRPWGTPDLSKLVRAVEDALTDSEVWGDDAQVVELHTAKGWAGAPGFLSVPGVLITISRLSQPPTAAERSHLSGAGV